MYYCVEYNMIVSWYLLKEFIEILNANAFRFDTISKNRVKF